MATTPQSLASRPPRLPTIQLRRRLANNTIRSWRQELGHFLAVMSCAFLIITVSLFIDAFMGNPVIPSPQPSIGFEAVLAGVAPAIMMVICFSIASAGGFDIRVNPYLTLLEWFPERNLGWRSAALEVIAQALGAAAAGGLTLGVLSATGDIPVGGVAGVISRTTAGWVFALEALAGFAMGWVYFHGTEFGFADAMGKTVGITSVILYPFAGATTHNVFRYLSSCVIAGTCGTPGWWAYVFGPGAGMIVGWAWYLATRHSRQEDVDEAAIEAAKQTHPAEMTERLLPMSGTRIGTARLRHL